MTQEQLSKLWSAIGALLLYYTLNSYLATQGAEPVFPAPLLTKAREPIAIFAILIGAPLLFLVASVGRVFASRAAGPSLGRIPVLWFDKIDSDSPEGRWYQRLALTAFTMLPALSFLHFFRILTTADVCASFPTAHKTTAWSLTAFTTLNDPARLGGLLTRDPAPPHEMMCQGGVTFFPLVEPLALLLLIVCAYWAVGRQFVAIWRCL